MGDHLLQRDDPPGTAADSLPDDPFALLQEEIAYLEHELRLRDETILSLQARAEDDIDHGADDKIKELTAELGRRDETIQLLFDQMQQIEEAESQHLKDWDQLRVYIEELERRSDPEAQEQDAAWRQHLEAELEEERRRAESERAARAGERQHWESRRQGWEEETRRLRDQLSEINRETDAQVNFALVALEEENQALRRRAQEAARDAEAARELDAIRAQLEQAQAEIDRLARGPVPDAGPDDPGSIAALRSRLEETSQNLRLANEAREQDQQAWQGQWESQRRAHESERKAWASKQTSWESELAYLRAQLAEATRNQDARATSVTAMAEENRRRSDQQPAPAPRTPRPPRPESRPMVDLRAMRAKLDQSQEEIQKRLWKLNQLRNLAQRQPGEPIKG